MELEISCRMCAGIAEPGVSLLDTTQLRLAAWASNNLDMQINANNRYPTKVCYPCMENIRRWMVFRDKCKKMHRKFCQELGLPETAGLVPIETDDVMSVGSTSNSSLKENTSPTQKVQKNNNSLNIGPKKKTSLDKWLQSSATQVKKIPPAPVQVESDDSDTIDAPNEMDLDNEDVSEPEEKYVPKPTLKTRSAVNLVQVKKEVKPDITKLDTIATNNASTMKNISTSLTVALQNYKIFDVKNRTKPLPVSVNSTPSPKKTTPASSEPMPSNEKSTPSPKNTTPASRKTASVSKRPMPASRKIISTSKNTTPASKKSRPASKKPMPASKKTSTAPTKKSMTEKQQNEGLPPEVLANIPKDQPFQVVPITKNGQTYYIVKPIGAPDLQEEIEEKKKRVESNDSSEEEIESEEEEPNDKNSPIELSDTTENEEDD